MATLYTVQTAAGVLHAALTLDEAASLLGIDPLELEWAIEEDGICSTLMTRARTSSWSPKATSGG